MIKYAGRIHRQSRPPGPTFSTNHIPDLTGSVVIVTGRDYDLLPLSLLSRPEHVGGNAGIGKETARVRSTTVSVWATQR